MQVRSFCLSIVCLVLVAGCTSSLPACVRKDCNCSDFQTQPEAQFVFDTFKKQGKGDIFQLDKDGDGKVCTSLPRQKAREKSKGRTAGASNASNTDPLRYGNPSNAAKKDKNNLLLEKSQYVLSYNCTKGTPNWVAWQLDRSWFGNVERRNDFRPDEELKDICYAVTPRDYTGTGYDRGHMAPSADRSRTAKDNSATFLMTNMVPQTPQNNREVWRELEEYSRDLVGSGRELYIVAGVEGKRKTIAKGKIVVPAYTWKAILVLEKPGAKVTETTRAIAVRIPNTEKVDNTDWTDYIVTIDDIEKKTGYDLFSKLPKKVQAVIEARADRGDG